MPTRKRPQPEFPAQGFLGALPNLGEGYSSEYSITIPHPTKPGYWTNVPTLTPNQEGTSAIPGDITDDQYQRAVDFAKWLATEGGYDLPAFKTPEYASDQAVHRHEGFDKADQEEMLKEAMKKMGAK
jgi:hypothetical protein